MPTSRNRCHISNLTVHLKNQEEQEAKHSSRKEITKIRVEINERETKHITEKFKETGSLKR